MISIIIPARNEEKNLQILLPSISQTNFKTSYEIIVCDDHSNDQTAEVACQFGAIICQVPSLPIGWTGKNWACWQGAQLAQGEILFFLDADTAFCPHADSSWIEIIQNSVEKIAISFGPYHKMTKLYEQLSIFFHWTMVISVKMDRKLFGQSLLIKKSDYFVGDGHQGVKDQVLENLMMAKTFQQAGVRCIPLLGNHFLQMRMFPQGLSQMIESWIKAFAVGAKNTGKMPMLVMISIYTLLFLSIISVVVLMPVGVYWYFLTAIILYWQWQKIGNYGVPTALLYPIPLCFFLMVFVGSSLRKHKTWKGRVVSP